MSSWDLSESNLYRNLEYHSIGKRETDPDLDIKLKKSPSTKKPIITPKPETTQKNVPNKQNNNKTATKDPPILPNMSVTYVEVTDDESDNTTVSTTEPPIQPVCDEVPVFESYIN